MSRLAFRSLGIFGYFFRAARATRAATRLSFRSLGIGRRTRASVNTVDDAVSGGRSLSPTRSRTHDFAPRRRSSRRESSSSRHRSRWTSRLHAEPLESRKVLAGASLAGVLPDLPLAFDSGYSNSDNITNNTAVDIDVTIPAGTTISAGDTLRLLNSSGSILMSLPAAATGLYTFPLVILPPGLNSLTAVLVDSSGAAGTASNPLVLTIDTTAPQVVAIATPAAQTFIPGATISFGLTFNEPVYVAGTPFLPITIGSGAASLMAPDVTRDASITGAAAPVATISADYLVGSLDGNLAIPESTDANGVEVNGTLTTTPGLPDDVFDVAGNSAVTLIGLGITSAANTAMAFTVLVNAAPTAIATFYAPDGTAVPAPNGSLGPRVTPLPTLTISFTDPATGLPQAVPFVVSPPGSPPSPPFGSGTLTIHDFRLTRNGVVITDLATKGVVISTPVAGPNAFADFQLAGLENVTNEPGAYTLTFSDLGVGYSRIVSWVKDYTTPGELRATLTASPAILNGITDAPVDSVTIRFTDAAGAVNDAYDPTDAVVPVTGVVRGLPDPSQFELYRDGNPVAGFNKTPVTVSGTGNTYTITGLAGLTKLDGAYELVLKDGKNNIYSLSDSDTSAPGSTLKAPESIKWQNVKRPTITITSSASTLMAGQTTTITFTLSKESATFDANDVTFTGGTIANFQQTAGNPLVYTATFTATATAPSAGSVTVAAGAFTDTAGVSNANPASVSIALNTVAPTVTITSNVPALNLGETARITFKLSSPSTTFSVGDVVVSGGVLSGFTGSGSDYTAVFTPLAGNALGLVSVPAGQFTDADGNGNLAGAIAQAITIDAVAPSISIVSSPATIKPGQTATITFTLSEPSATTSSFAAGDVVVSGGTLSGFAQISPTVYTATLTPAANASAAIVAVPAGAFADAAGNANAGPAQIMVTVDDGAPTVVGVGVASASAYEIYRVGQTIPFTVKFSEAVTVTGSPSLNVLIGTGATETARTATYSGGSGTDTLTFHYAVASADTNDVDGIRIQALVLPTGSSIIDAVGNSAVLSIAAARVTGNVFVVAKASAPPQFTLLPNPLTNPRATPVSVVRVIFDNPVPFVPNTAGTNGLDGPGLLSLDDFELVRGGSTPVVVPFPAGARLIQSGTSFREFEISNLSELTEPVGTYILTFADAKIAERATTTWIKSTSTPGELTAAISLAPSAATPRRIPVDTATIAFSRVVVNVDLTDFVFRKNGVVVPWSATSAVLSGGGDSYVISGLTTATNDPGSTYEITLLADDQATVPVESDVATLAGGKLIAPVAARWTFEPPVGIVSVAPIAVPPSGFFRVGDVMEFSVKFSEPVFVTNPQFITLPLQLGTGAAGGPGSVVQAGYVGGDATDTLRFRYLPQPTDEDLDGILLTGALSLGTGTNVGTIRDSAGIDAVLTYTQPDTTLLRVDSRAPVITSVVGPANGTYGIGDSLEFTVTFDESVTVSGQPRIPLVIGTKTVYAYVVAGEETPTLVFQYGILPGDNDSNGIVASTQIALNNGGVGDVAGNPAILRFPAPLNLSNVLVDTAAPAAPVILAVAADKTGAEVVVPNGGSTSDNTLKVTGTAEPNSSVTVFVNGVPAGAPVTVPASGQWTFPTFTLASNLPTGNAYAFTATATDAMKNVSPLSAPPYVVTVDTTPPTAPSVVPLVTINPRPTITGAAILLAGEVLTVTVNGSTYTVAPDGNGNWSLNLATAVPSFPPLGTGTYAVTAVVTDLAGNFTRDPTTSELTVDTSPVTVNTLQTNKPRPTITGTAVIPTGGRLEVTVNGLTYTVVPANDGTWALNLAAVTTPAFPALGDGVYSVDAVVFDPSGVSIADPTSNELQIDTTGPAVVSVDSPTPDGFYKAGASISIQVRFTDDVVVDTTLGVPRLALNTGRTAVYDAVASTARTLTFIYSVQPGDNTADLDCASTGALALNGATIRDASGNDALLTLPVPGAANSLGFNRSITIDTAAPSPPPTVYPLSTNNPLPTITGTAVLGAGETLTVTVNGTSYSPAFVTIDSWSLDLATASPLPGSPPLAPLAAGLKYNVIATITDQAGNSTNDLTTNELSISSFAPVIVGALDDVAPGISILPSGRVTNDPAPTLIGTANPGWTVTVSVGTTVIGSTISDAAGNWTFTPTSNLIDGSYSFSVESTAPAGGTAIKSVVPFLITVDTTSPTAGAITAPAGIYRAGQTVRFSVTFSEPVFVVGVPTLDVLVGTGTAAVTRTATYTAGSGTPTLVFAYTLQTADVNDVDGVVVSSVLLPSSAVTIRDAAGNDAVLALANGSVQPVATATSPAPASVFLMPRTAIPSFTLFPVARINPRATPVSVVRVVFDNPVPFVQTVAAPNGVDATGWLSLADFELTYNGSFLALPTGTGTAPAARLIPGSSYTEFEISNLSSVTEAPGTYILTFADLQIGPHKPFTWTKTEVTPAQLTATITLNPTATTAPRQTPVDSATIAFSENVDNVDLSDFELWRNGVRIPWAGSGAVLSATNAGSTYTITGLTALTSGTGSYALKLLADDQSTIAIESDISSYTGGQLIGPVSAAWTFEQSIRVVAGGVTLSPTPASGFFKKGDVMTFSVRYTEPVFLSNPSAVKLPFVLGGSTVNADYAGGHGTDTLAFRYTVQPGDEDRDGIVLLGSLTTGGGTIRNASGAAADLVFSPPDTSLVFVDGVNPSLLTPVVGPTAGMYVLGQTLRFTATFSEPMTVVGTPRIAMTIGSTLRYANYVAGAETGVLVFEYQIQPGDVDSDGIVVASSISANGGAITDVAGNTCGLTFPVLNTTNVRVDGTAPVVISFSSSKPDGFYKAGATIDITATVSEPVVAGSRLFVVLNTGAPPVQLSAATAGTSLQGTYNVATGENTSDLTVIAILDAGTKDSNGNGLGGTALPAAPNNLGDAKSIVIDTAAPTPPTVDPLATRNPTPVVTGTAMLGAGEILDVEVRNASGIAVVPFTRVVPVAGTWQLLIVSPLTDGLYTITARITDPATNVGTGTGQLRIDTIPPPAPTVTSFVTNLRRPALGGTASLAAGESITIKIAGEEFTPTPNGNSWSIDLASQTSLKGILIPLLDEAPYTITAIATDALGNSSSGTGTVTVDLTAPLAPELRLATNIDPTKRVGLAQATQSAGVIQVRGELNAKIVIGFSGAGGALPTKSVTGTGNWQGVPLTAAEAQLLNDGTVTVTATQSDLASNASPQGALQFMLGIEPAAPVLTAGPGTANGASRVEAMTWLASVSGEPGATATVTIRNTSKGTAVTQSYPLLTSGTAIIKLSAAELATLGDGSIRIEATQTDANGNAQVASPSVVTLTLDATAPLAPTLALNAAVTDGATTTEATSAAGVVSVTGEPSATITVKFTGPLGPVTKTLTGTGGPQPITLSSTDIVLLGQGTILIEATQVDLAGNAQAVAASTASFTYDAMIKALVAGWGESATNAPRIPRSSATTLKVTFNTPVTGFTATNANIRLYYEGRQVDISGTTISGSGASYTVTLPSRAVPYAGLYRIEIGGPGSTIRDSSGIAMDVASIWYAQLT